MDNNSVHQLHENNEHSQIIKWRDTSDPSPRLNNSPFNSNDNQSQIIPPHFRHNQEMSHIGISRQLSGNSFIHDSIFQREGKNSDILDHHYHTAPDALHSPADSSSTESLEQLPITKDNAASIFRQRNVYQDFRPRKRQKKLLNSNHDMEMIQVLQQETHQQFSNEPQKTVEENKKMRSHEPVTSSRQVSSQSFYGTSFDVVGDEKVLGGLHMNPSYHSTTNSNKHVFSQAPSKVPIPTMTSRVVSDIINDPHTDGKLSNERTSSYSIGNEERVEGNGEHQKNGPLEQCRESVEVTPPHLQHNRAMYFYALLHTFDAAFSDFTFLLPGLKGRSSHNLRCPSRISFNCLDESMRGNGEIKRDRASTSSQSVYSLNPQDLKLAKTRLKCAVCALGGSVGDGPKLLSESNASSIFRIEHEQEKECESKTESRLKYEKTLPLRYYENQERMSWDIEELPPVETNSSKGGRVFQIENNRPNRMEKISSNTADKKGERKETRVNDLNNCPNGSKEKRDVAAGGSIPKKVTPKMKYRCKLCGQLKQNHTCPYQQSLQRSIGTMSHPALNSYHMDEQGQLSPSLTEMNNFAANDDDDMKALTTSRSGIDIRSVDSTEGNALPTENKQGMEYLKQRSTSLTSSSRHLSRLNSNQGRCNDTEMDFIASIKDKRRRKEIRGSALQLETKGDSSEDALFLEEKVITSQQCRTVTPQKVYLGLQFNYPTIPLTFAQRKMMSQSLFSLSEEIPGLTDECAVTLIEARKTNAWDLAIAELMTQILVIVHCPFGDFRLDGLQRYLLTMGFSC